MRGIDAEMLAQMNTKTLAVQVSTGTQYCGAGVSSRVRYPPAGPEGRLRQAIRPGRRVHDLRHDVAVNFGIRSEQPETTLWVIAIGSAASLFVHARCDQYDPCVFKIRVVAVDEVHFTSDWHAISDVGRDCLGGLSRAIDQNDFACAAGTAAAMAEAQPTLPVPTIPIFIDPSGVDRSQRDVSRSVPGESGSPCRSRLTGDAVDGFFSFERQAWSLVKWRPICPGLICDRH